MRITKKEYAISGMCWRKEVGLSQNLFISMGIVPVPCAFFVAEHFILPQTVCVC